MIQNGMLFIQLLHIQEFLSESFQKHRNSVSEWVLGGGISFLRDVSLGFVMDDEDRNSGVCSRESVEDHVSIQIPDQKKINCDRFSGRLVWDFNSSRFLSHNEMQLCIILLIGECRADHILDWNRLFFLLAMTGEAFIDV